MPGVKKSICANCEKPVCVSASTLEFTGTLILICFDCHIKRIEKINEPVVLAITPEAVKETIEFMNMSRN